MKKTVVALLVALFSGCASQAELDARNVEDINVSGKDPVCVRQSLAVYSACVAEASKTIGDSGRVVATWTACKSAYRVSISTCTAK
ncbi:MAG: hypothetical protein Q7U94_08345 [Sideroxyarcus sp.]|nr:hypothetical protein [Sideroxyarcus sp.]